MKSTQAGSTGWVEIHVEGEAASYRSGQSLLAIGQVTAQMSEVTKACDNLEPALIPLAHRTSAEAAAAALAVGKRLQGQEPVRQAPVPVSFTRKCNFKESEAAKEMAKTDDNVKEFLEKVIIAATATQSCNMLVHLELGRGSWLLASLELGRGCWLLASLELGSGSWRLVSLELGRGSWRLGKLAAMSKLFNERVAYGETGALYATGLLDPRYRGRHTELTHSQVMMADMCIAELASADGQGTDRAAGDARFNLHQRWLMPKALQLVGLSNSVLDTVLTANPCLWWQTYGHGFGVLRDVAMRLLSIPVTSASTERVFSTFKHIWSDHRQSMLMGRMWMSSYIYFNRRALKGTRGQTRSSEEERAEFEEWLQHQPNGISK
ncbi:hypothetical protein QJQ45_011232 [Haematococcus lacustris]|nr:hypothetical protein QJQ45_011232 [Haematococcus lacustris]